jgi:hypothetical protein
MKENRTLRRLKAVGAEAPRAAEDDDSEHGQESVKGLSAAHQERQQLLIKAAKTSSASIDQWMDKFSQRSIHPYVIKPVLNDALRGAFEIPCISICPQFVLSIGELIGVVEHAHTLHLPSHTQQERDYMTAFRAVCRQQIDLIRKPNSNSERPNTSGMPPDPRIAEMIRALENLKRLPELQKRYLEEIRKMLGQTLHGWQTEALQMLWHLVEKAAVMKLDAFSHQAQLTSPTRPATAESNTTPRQRHPLLPSPPLHPDFERPLGPSQSVSEAHVHERPLSIYGPCRVPAIVQENMERVQALEPEVIARVNVLRRRDRTHFTHTLTHALFSALALRESKHAPLNVEIPSIGWGGDGLCVDKRFGNDMHSRGGQLMPVTPSGGSVTPSGGSNTPAPATSVGGGVVGRGSLEPLWKQIVDAPTHEKGKKHKAVTHVAGATQPKVSALASADARLVPFSRPSPILLAQGISPKFWFDPVTSVYRFVPTSPCVGSHPQLRPSGYRRTTVRHVRTSRPSSASKPQLRDEVHRLTEGRVTTPRFRV